MSTDRNSQRFQKVAKTRAEKISDLIRLLGNCANKNNYKYTKNEAELMIDSLISQLEGLKPVYGIKSSKNNFVDYFSNAYTWTEGFMRNVSRYSNKKALIFPAKEMSLTYKELNGEVNRLSYAIIQHGMKKKDVIMYMLKNRPEFIYTYIACHKTGSVGVPVNCRLAPYELKYLIDVCRPAVFIFEEEMAETVKRALNYCKHVPRFLISVSNGKKPSYTFDGVMSYERFVRDFSTSEPVTDVKNNIYDVSEIMFTSGGSGKPKPVCITEINDVLSSHDVIMHLPLNFTDTTMSMTPWFHRGGLGSVISTLYAGGCVVAMSKFDAKNSLKYVKKYNITFLIGVPTVLEVLSKMQEREGEDLSSLNGIITMGANLDKASCMKYQKILTPNIFNGYGTAETFWNTFLRPFDLPEEAGTSGISCVDDDVRVVRMYDGKHAEPNDTVDTDGLTEGEIIIRSPAKCSYAYYNDTGNSDYYKGYLYTGDIGTWDSKKYISVTGNRNHIINSCGENINPKQVESVICSMKGIVDCAVTSVSNKVRIEDVTAYIVKGKNGPTIAEIDAFCKENDQLANYKRPRHYRFIQEIPKDDDGNILRDMLKKMADDDLENGLLLRI